MAASEGMSDFRKKLPKWTAVSQGDNSYDKGEEGAAGGSRSSSTELLTPDSEFTREWPHSVLSLWKPVWYTGWHTGVLACTTSVIVVLLINVGLAVYAATNPGYEMERGIGTLYEGRCDKSRKIGLWLHLGINALSTLLLSGSNYTQQCLAAPTRSEIDVAHARRRWMDIGVPSVRNLFRIKPERALLWTAIGFTSIPLHFLYNSVVYTSLSANDFLVTVVTKDHFEPGAYSNLSMVSWFLPWLNATTGEGYRYLDDMELLKSMLEGHNASTHRYEDLTPSECVKFYNTDFVSDHRNLFLITNHNSNTTQNNTLLGMTLVRADYKSPESWICNYGGEDTTQTYLPNSFNCTPSELARYLRGGFPWHVKLDRVREVEISGCKSERAAEKCKVQFSLGIMIAVICCNLVKACSMIIAVIRSREPTLVTLGDAVDSFLRAPDPTTMGICYADRRFIEREWRRGWKAEPRYWKQKGVQRWWTSVSKGRWIACIFFCLITIIVAGILLWLGMVKDGRVWSIDLKSMWDRGLSRVNTVSLVTIRFRNITQAILLANLPQTILSFLYLTYNSLFTCMLSGHEWSLFCHHHRTLRVTSPRPGQRSTYWLQIPYTYAIPLMTLSGLLHWLTSQSIFLAKVDLWTSFGMEISGTISTVGYSCIATIFLLVLGILALLAAVGMGYKPFAGEITTVGSCSAAISAACHIWETDSEGIVGKKVRWGDVGIAPISEVRHLAFSSEEGVKKPVLGEVYAGTRETGSDNL